MSDLEEYLLVVDEPKYIKEFYDMRGAEARAIDYVLIIEQFQKLLGVYTATEALAKVAEFMQKENVAEHSVQPTGQLCAHGKGHCQCDNPRCQNYCD